MVHSSSVKAEALFCLPRKRLNIAGEKRSVRLSIPVPLCRVEVQKVKPVESINSRICAPMVMTENKRAKAAIPHQDTRNLSCPPWFSSPRGTTCKTDFRREKKDMRRISHGSARDFEGLRGVRLSLVPRPDPWKCLLQAM